MAINIDGNGLITLGGTASTQGRVRLSEDTDNGTNYIELTAPASVASDKTITFPDATGTVVISGTTPSLNGITFPATQVASADVNTLDDYEEGTWTPSLGGNATYNAATYGIYRKIGNLVVAVFHMRVTTLGTGSTTTLSGLPFTNATADLVPGYIGFFFNLAISTIFVSCYVNTSTTTVDFSSQPASDGSMDSAAAIFGNGTDIYGAVIYTA